MPRLFPAYTGPALMPQVVSVANLTEAWRRVLSNIQVERRQHSAGIDAVTLRDFEADWPNQMQILADELSSGLYRPLPPRRVAIPKASGGERVIAILAVRDRIAQRAMQQVLEPVFDPILLDCSFGCRARVGVPHALEQVTRYAERGLTWVVDADIQSYFDTINHRLLLAMLRQRIEEVRVLQLIAQWLEVATMDDVLPATATPPVIESPPPSSPLDMYASMLGWGAPPPASPYAAAQWEQPHGWQSGGSGLAGMMPLSEQLWLAAKYAQPAIVGAKYVLPHLQKIDRQKAAMVGVAVAGLAGAAVLGERWFREQFAVRQGALQGGSLSPLLANIYLHPFDLALTTHGFRLVRFMDDFVILCSSEAEAQQAYRLAERQMAMLQLKLHPEKSRIVRYEDGFEFLGQALVPRQRGPRLTDGVQSFTDAAQRLRANAQQQAQQWRKGRKGHKDKEGGAE